MRKPFVRVAYFMGLLSLGTWTANNFAGGTIYSSGDGMVVGDLGVVSPEYTVTVLDILVHNGDRVHKGDVIARVESSRIAQLIATLSDNSSMLVAKTAEIAAKASMIDQLVGAAQQREQVVNANQVAIDQSRNKNLIPMLTQNAVIEQVFKGREELAVLLATRDTMSQQVAQVTAASRFTDQALDDLGKLFDAGRMKSPMDGFVSSVNARVGSVINPGDLVIELVGEKPYVLAYFPVSRLYDLNAGKSVLINAGVRQWLRGTVTTVAPIAAPLPREFQRTLAPVDRQQLVRVDFDNGVIPPPYFTKVTVH